MDRQIRRGYCCIRMKAIPGLPVSPPRSRLSKACSLPFFFFPPPPRFYSFLSSSSLSPASLSSVPHPNASSSIHTSQPTTALSREPRTGTNNKYEFCDEGKRLAKIIGVAWRSQSASENGFFIIILRPQLYIPILPLFFVFFPLFLSLSLSPSPPLPLSLSISLTSPL